MARLLNATGYVSSVLAAVCLVLALVAAPIGEARADDPPPTESGIPVPCQLFTSNCVDLLKICPPFFYCVYDSTLGRCTCA